ncbi:MAG: hypothetical protein GXP05_11005 [Alphaproteobacteria bacterium]|nr:hypothetical protein [Alphaproteobacteria bacterium]
MNSRLAAEEVIIRRTVPAMSTPLASIFGSGFLVVIPILASAVGPYAIIAIVIVALVAHQVGAIVRHNILCAEPVLAANSNRVTLVAERLSDIALIGAYVVSVCLYLHILAAFVLAPFGLNNAFNESLMTSSIVGVITLIGMFGGLAPLEKLERIALYLTIAILAALLVGFAVFDIGQFIKLGAFSRPAMPERTPWEIATMVAGTLIIVQGFETTRYLGAEFTAKVRIRASRWSQYFSLSVYVIFVALAQPLVPVLNGVYDDNSLIAIATAASFLLPLPLIIAAGMSQFSAAVADTLAAAANIKENTGGRLSSRWGYLAVGVAAMALAWMGTTFQFIAIASRAFAFYYLLQCVVGYSVCTNHWQRARFIIIGSILAFVLIFAVPAG